MYAMCAMCIKALVCLLQTADPSWLERFVTMPADVQEIQPKDANPAQGNKRVKITVSDGLWKCSAVLASQLKELVDTHQLVKGAIIEVIELVGNKKLQANPNAALNSKK